VFLAAQMASETTAAAVGKVGELRFDPMAMLPFCGYHMGDYFAHWLKVGQRAGAEPPRIFFVNWFRKGPDGKFLWPGFGENSRVLAWIFSRCAGTASAVWTPIGNVPVIGSDGIEIEGLPTSVEELELLLKVDPDQWAGTLEQVRAHFARFGDKLPPEFAQMLDAFEKRLAA
jgi:phosphoenolpyruvate carboxykinase (GTP)